MKKKVIKKVIYSHGLTVGIKHNYRTLTQKKYVENIQKELKEKQKYINLKNDVIPYISKKHAYVLTNYMCGYSTETLADLQKKFGYKNLSTTYRIPQIILREIDGIIKGKEAVKKFVNFLGGKNGVEDIKLFFDDKELEIFDNVIMSPHPKANEVYSENFGKKTPTVTKEKDKLLNKIFNIIERKNECQRFIEENGGEDFLINEFGPCLSEKSFDVLANFMMDYHYSNFTNSSTAMGEPINYLLLVKGRILKQLKEYNERKIEVANMLEAAGGEERVFNEIYSKLDDNEKIIFEERFLAYFKTPFVDIARKIGLSVDYVNKHAIKINRQLEQLKVISQNHKQN